MNCIVCSKDTLCTIPYHDDCMLCIFCHRGVGLIVVEKLIKQGITEVYHVPCKDTEEAKAYAERPVTVTQGTLDYVNRFNLLFMPNLELSIAGNQAEAELKLLPCVSDMTLDQLGLTLKRMESATAMLSILISKHKDTIRIRSQERDRERFEEVQDIRTEQINDDFAKRKRSRQKEEARQAGAKEREERKAIARDPKLKAKESTIKQLMSFGMTREAAEATVGATKQ